MNEQKFMNAISLLREFSIEELRQSRRNLMDILSIIEDEKKNASIEVRKVMHHLQILRKSKLKRLEYIDKYLLPDRVKAVKLKVVQAFGQAQSSVLQRINQLHREKEQIQKNSNEHELKAKINLRSLIEIYGEEKRILNYMDLLTTADLLYDFLRQRRIDIHILNNKEMRELYTEYMSRG